MMAPARRATGAAFKILAMTLTSTSNDLTMRVHDQPELEREIIFCKVTPIGLLCDGQMQSQLGCRGG